MAVKVVMPQLGESVVEGKVVKWLRREGETINELDLLVEIETDKVATEIPSPSAGTVLKISVPEGETVRAGTVLALIGQPGEALPGGDQPLLSGPSLPAQPSAAALPQPGRNPQLGFISPLVARLAHEFKVDLALVRGTGESGRITKKDVLDFINSKNAGAAPSLTDISPWDIPGSGDLFKLTESIPAAIPGQVKTTSAPEQGAAGNQLVAHSPMRMNIAERMRLSRSVAAHVTTVMEVDLLKVAAHRQANQAAFEHDGTHLTYTTYFASAAISALKAFPVMNAFWMEQGLQMHSDVNLGIAVSLGNEGLIVPVIRDAASLSLIGLAQRINDLASRARSRQLKPDDVSGGTFTMTNHGTGGSSLFATPIINLPQSGILGVGIIKKRPVVVDGDAIAVHPMVYLSLSFDHRVMDGAYADDFLSHIGQKLEKWS